MRIESMPKNLKIQPYFPDQKLSDIAKEIKNKIAIVFQDDELQYSYQDLQSNINAYSRILLNNKVNKSDVVIFCLPRSTDYVFWMFAIWQVAAIYLPIDPDQGGDYLHAVTQQVQNSLIITNSELAKKFYITKYINVADAHPIKMRNDENNNEIDAEITSLPKRDITDFSYIVSSSGSSGKPKIIANRYEGFASRIS